MFSPTEQLNSINFEPILFRTTGLTLVAEVALKWCWNSGFRLSIASLPNRKAVAVGAVRFNALLSFIDAFTCTKVDVDVIATPDRRRIEYWTEIDDVRTEETLPMYFPIDIRFFLYFSLSLSLFIFRRFYFPRPLLTPPPPPLLILFVSFFLNFQPASTTPSFSFMKLNGKCETKALEVKSRCASKTRKWHQGNWHRRLNAEVRK